MYHDPPAVRLNNHTTHVGRILAWRLQPSGEWEAHIEWIEMEPRGLGQEMVEHDGWLPAHKVQKIDGEDYSKVPRTKAAN